MMQSATLTLNARPVRGLGARPVHRPRPSVVVSRKRCVVPARVAASAAPQVLSRPPPGVQSSNKELEAVITDFSAHNNPQDRLKLLLEHAKQLPPIPVAAKTDSNRVMGCTAQAWVEARLDGAGRVQLAADSDSAVTRGLAAVLVRGLSGLAPAEVLAVEPAALSALGLGPAVLTPSRANGFANMLEAIKRRTRMLTSDLPTFPSLLIDASGFTAQGDFARAQADYLQPDAEQVDGLVEVLSVKKIGLVAHFYMDPQVQGVLSSAAERWPHIHISDSLVMADRAVAMVEAGCTAVAVLGVDFMSENVRAILDEAGHSDVQVYRMAADDIGCSLAEAAEADPYTAYLADAQATPRSLHVVYINTSLRTKAYAHDAVPTITCTSSNVVQTVLQAFAQVPDLSVWYGPDTYMGQNLAALFTSLAQMSDDEVRVIHPAHTQATIQALLPRLHYFQEGTCIVHHIFGGRVTETVAAAYSDAYLTAHFEVPGEMFALAMAARRERDMGVVGSTQNILDFIAAKLKTALEQTFGDKLQFVLGTESGMITSIVRKVQFMLAESGRKDVTVEIVFPVSGDAITTGKQSNGGGAPPTLPNGLAVVPGAAKGEGCSAEGGCASCPYMKMNSLTALRTVCKRIGTPAGEAMLQAYKPRQYSETVGGRSMAQAGCEPILHMRGFQKAGALPDALVSDIVTRNNG